MVRIQVQRRPAGNSRHVALHAASIALAAATQAISAAFFVLTSDRCVPNGE